ncbi:MAG: glutaminyl-peptide cyclotransferase [Planctomycetaceae bacterium]
MRSNNRRLFSKLQNLFRPETAAHSKRRSRRAENAGPGLEALEPRLVLSAQYVPNQVLVGVDRLSLNDSTGPGVAAVIEGSEVRPLGNYGVFLMNLPAGVTVPQAIEQLKGKPGIRYAEPNWIGDWTNTPNDPDYSRMWGMENTGQSVNGTTGRPDADTDADSAWDQTTGSKSVLVAIVDSGTDYRHPDLAANIYVNSGEIAGNGIDDDNNGYVDDVNGYDFADGDADPMDFVGHGTHVSGTVGAVGDNGIGTVGMNWNVSILPCKIGADLGGPVTSASIEAINYAVSMGAVVSNHSYTVNPTQALEDAIINARANNHIVVVAAGNSSSNNDFNPVYPASYPEDNIVVAAATDQNDALAGFSNRGFNSVDIGAPGVNIWSTTPTAGSAFYGPDYDFSDGTSMASPMVTGAIAMLRSVSPSASYQTIIQALYAGADRLPALFGRVSSGARLNVNGALQQLKAVSMSISKNTISENDGAAAATVTLRKVTAPFNQAVTVTLLISDGTEASSGGKVSLPVTIPAFQRQVTVPIDAVDDTLLDGTQQVVISIDYLGSEQDRVILDVLDHETISVLATPDIVFEDAGTNAGTLTISRSNTDIFSPDRIVAVNNSLRFFDRQGLLKSTVPVPWPSGFRPTGQTVRDVAVMEDGKIAVFNGTSTVYISIYNPGDGSWTHQIINNASASASDAGTGGLATSGTSVYISDLETSAGDAYGLVRYDVSSGQIDRFGTKAFGPRLFGSTWPESDVYELDPTTGASIRNFKTPASGGGSAGCAFDGKYIWFIVDDSSNNLYKIDADTGSVVDTFFVGSTSNTGFEGLAYLNGLIYLMDGFIKDDIVVYDPVLRTIVNVLDVDGINGGFGLDLTGGLAPNPARNSLFVTSTFSDTVYEISAKSGLVLSKPDGSYRTWSSGEYWEGGLATLRNELYVGATAGGNKIRVFDLDGNYKRTIDQPFFFGLESLGGDGIDGLVDSSLRYRDVIVGFDGFVYALDVNGTDVGKFDPLTLEPLSFFTLSTPITTLATDTTGNFYGGTAVGEIVKFGPGGNELSRIVGNLGAISDIEINVSGSLIVAEQNGRFAYGDTSLATLAEYPSGSNRPAFASFGEHFTRNRGELKIRLTNSDPSEISFVLDVTIPEGQQTIVIPFDAVDDAERDGVQIVTITADMDSPTVSIPPVYVPGSETVTVLDKEQILVSVAADAVSESAGPNASVVTVSRSDINGPFDYVTEQTFSNPATVQLLDRATTLSAITVPGQISRIVDVNVTVNFRHDWLGDLDVFLISPSGRRVELFSDITTNERNMISTVLDDEASSSILAANAPYTGRFMPEGQLSDFINEEAQGTWYLEMTDDNVNDYGRLNGWSLSFKTVGLSPATVVLRSSDTSEAAFGGSATRTVTIPANQSSVQTTVDAVDDTLLDGTQTVSIAASSVNVVGLDLGADSLQVNDNEQLDFSLSANSIREDAVAGTVTGILTRRNTDLSAFSLRVLSSNLSRLGFAGSDPDGSLLVTFPAGVQTVTFDLQPVDNSTIDGDSVVNITVVAPEYGTSQSLPVTVLDVEPQVVLALPAQTTLLENGGSFVLKVSRTNTTDLSSDFTVNLSVSGDASAVSLPLSVVIAAGFGTTDVVVILNDDTLLGDRSIVITGTSAGAISGSLPLTIGDYETIQLSLGKTSFLENAGAKAAVGTVTRSNSDNGLPLTVTLTSSDLSELTVPATVTIPAGQASVSFDVAAVNDPDLDGPQQVVVTASSAGYQSTSVNVTVLDHEPPVISSPAATTTAPRPTISWNVLPGATSYDLQIAAISAGVNTFIVKSGLTVNSFTPPENLGIGLYRVWVRAYDQFEIPGFWSVPRDFFVQTAPAITAPSQTNNVASAAFPEISWTAVADATRYHLWVNNLTTGKAQVINVTNLVTTSYKSDVNLGTGTYRAFVKAFNSKNEGGTWSLAKDFTVLAPPVITLPTTGSSFDRTPTFTWSSVVGAKYYDLYVSDAATKAVVLRNQAITGTSITAVRDLAFGNYEMWMRTIGTTHVSPWSAVRRFSIGAPPVVTSPVANARVSSKTTFTWTAVGDTERYELWVAPAASPQQPVIRLTNLTNTSFTPASSIPAGTYRVWVKAVSNMGESSAWSAGVTFTIVSSDAAQPIMPIAAAPLNTSLALLTQPVAVRRSNVANAKPTTTAAQSTETAPVAVARTETAAPQQNGSRDTATVDSIMEQWDAADWWLASDLNTVAATDSTTSRSRRQI